MELFLECVQASHLKLYSTNKSESQESKETKEDEDEKAKREKAWKKMKISLIVTGSIFGTMFCWTFYIFGKLNCHSLFYIRL